MQYATLLFDVRDNVAHITLNRPEAANSINTEMAIDQGLKNDTSVGKYLFLGMATLEMFGELVGFAMATPESPGSHRGAQCRGEVWH